MKNRAAARFFSYRG